MFCIKCGRKLENSWKTCPNCGTPVNEVPSDTQKSQKIPIYMKWWFWVSTMVFSIILLVILSFLLIRKNNPTPQNVDHEQIEDIKKKSKKTDDSTIKNTEQKDYSEIVSEETTPKIKEREKEITITSTPPELTFNTERVGYYSNGYWAMDLKSIDIQSKKITYDGYEGGYSDIPSCSDQEGTIIDDRTLDIYGVQLIWDDEQSFTIHNAEDCMIFSSMAGSTESHDVQHGAGVYTKMQKPELTPTSTSFSFIGVDGIFYDFSNGSGDPDLLNVRIFDITDTTFRFSIYQGQEIIFMQNTAEITGDTTGVYHGIEYTLYFDWTDGGTVYVSGFQPTEGVSFINNAYYQVS